MRGGFWDCLKVCGAEDFGWKGVGFWCWWFRCLGSFWVDAGSGMGGDGWSLVGCGLGKELEEIGGLWRGLLLEKEDGFWEKEC